jgi:hypothetical protein
MRGAPQSRFAQLISRINNSISEMPSDAWLNAELRERGCPDAMLERWRKRIRATPLHYISNGAGSSCSFPQRRRSP